MAKVSKRIVNSYKAYLGHREKGSAAGYGFDRPLTLEEYEEVHIAFIHDKQNAHKTHVAREIAQRDKTFTRDEASAIVRRLKNADIYESEYLDKALLSELRSTYKKAKDIYSLQLTPEEQEILEQRRRENLVKRGKNPAEYNIQASARAELFNELIDAGISYKETRYIVYGD